MKIIDLMVRDIFTVSVTVIMFYFACSGMIKGKKTRVFFEVLDSDQTCESLGLKFMFNCKRELRAVSSDVTHWIVKMVRIAVRVMLCRLTFG